MKWFVTYRRGGAIDVTEASVAMMMNRRVIDGRSTGDGLFVIDEASSLAEGREKVRAWKALRRTKREQVQRADGQGTEVREGAEPGGAE